MQAGDMVIYDDCHDVSYDYEPPAGAAPAVAGAPAFANKANTGAGSGIAGAPVFVTTKFAIFLFMIQRSSLFE